ncbi:hypothetical protein SmJEL517_g03167 [Synchytrium microbalum]|uniref:Enoyl-CoA hydratase n=1 Tax=Synchytrium microbalum TaxID=1806994 RepID=A0A507C3X6_9FUNG|nr:uncharacterized protein SmJEL517_g03167 [Synchytrium microbalum]TPX34088.1 hypothetical protein SmJEL517_g03167 [Synchytrium microbalum]
MAPKFEDLKVEIDGSVATITFMRHDTYNSLKYSTYAEISKALRYIDNQDQVVFTVVTGGDCKFFSSGQNLQNAISQPVPADRDEARAAATISLNAGPASAAYALVEHKKVTIAALNGPVIGWPAAWVATFDIILAADNAYVYMPFMRLGASIEAAGSFSWPYRVGSGLAADMVLTGRKVTAQELLAVGGVQRVYPVASFAKDVAAFMAEMKTLNARSLLEAKFLMREPVRNAMRAAVTAETHYQIEKSGGPRDNSTTSGFAMRAKEIADAKAAKAAKAAKLNDSEGEAALAYNREVLRRDVPNAKVNTVAPFDLVPLTVPNTNIVTNHADVDDTEAAIAAVAMTQPQKIDKSSEFRGVAKMGEKWLAYVSLPLGKYELGLNLAAAARFHSFQLNIWEEKSSSSSLAASCRPCKALELRVCGSGPYCII